MAVAGTEIRRATEALERVAAEIGTLEALDHRATAIAKALRGRVAELTGLAQAIRRGVVRQQCLTGERPAAVRHVIAHFEVDRVERHAATAPGRGRDAEAPL